MDILGLRGLTKSDHKKPLEFMGNPNVKARAIMSEAFDVLKSKSNERATTIESIMQEKHLYKQASRVAASGSEAGGWYIMVIVIYHMI